MTDFGKQTTENGNRIKHSAEAPHNNDMTSKRVKANEDSSLMHHDVGPSLQLPVNDCSKGATFTTNKSELGSKDSRGSNLKEDIRGGVTTSTHQVGGDDCMENGGGMNRVENDFFQLKDKFINDKIAAVRFEVAQIETDSHEAINAEIKLLEARRVKKIILAEQIHKHRLESIDLTLAADIQCANDELNQDIYELRERVLRVLANKQKELEEQQRDISLCGKSCQRTYSSSMSSSDTCKDGGLVDTQRISTRALRKRGGKDMLLHDACANGDTSAKHIPEIRVKLADNEIEYDMAVIQRV